MQDIIFIGRIKIDPGACFRSRDEPSVCSRFDSRVVYEGVGGVLLVTLFL
jgi:hypothetical protein